MLSQIQRFLTAGDSNAVEELNESVQQLDQIITSSPAGENHLCEPVQLSDSDLSSRRDTIKLAESIVDAVETSGLADSAESREVVEQTRAILASLNTAITDRVISKDECSQLREELLVAMRAVLDDMEPASPTEDEDEGAEDDGLDSGEFSVLEVQNSAGWLGSRFVDWLVGKSLRGLLQIPGILPERLQSWYKRWYCSYNAATRGVEVPDTYRYPYQIGEHVPTGRVPLGNSEVRCAYDRLLGTPANGRDCRAVVSCVYKHLRTQHAQGHRIGRDNGVMLGIAFDTGSNRFVGTVSGILGANENDEAAQRAKNVLVDAYNRCADKLHLDVQIAPVLLFEDEVKHLEHRKRILATKQQMDLSLKDKFERGKLGWPKIRR